MHMLAMIKTHTKTNTNTKKGEKTSRKKVFMGEEGWASEDAQSVNTLCKGLQKYCEKLLVDHVTTSMIVDYQLEVARNEGLMCCWDRV